jgi:hypothetical protein
MTSPTTAAAPSGTPGRSCSPFLAWFEEQHGKRPHPYGQDDKLQRDVDKGTAARELLAACRIYDARRQSALYAWTANVPHEPLPKAAGGTA